MPASVPAIATNETVAVRDAAVIELVAKGEEALQRSRQRMPTAVLRQVDFGLDLNILTFRFTDAAATRTLSITFRELVSASGQWQVIEQGLTPLTGDPHPGMDLGALRTGPAAVGQAIIANWPDCGPPGFTLGGTGTELIWHVGCTIEAGSVSGILDHSTGVFTPSPAPPVRPAPTAVPNQR